jgi:glucans biosynthesis protein
MVSRRHLLAGAASAAALHAAHPALAQAAPPPQPASAFPYAEVVRRARELASAPFDASMPPLPEGLASLSFDAYRDIRYRPDRALLPPGGPFRMQMFHLGFLFRRPVTVNVIREGMPTPVLYQPGLFDLGRNRFERPLPINLGFAGFRLHYPLNRPNVFDELIAFLGASYFRFLGRDQRYGLSARALALRVEGSGQPEEFPFFREFWVDTTTSGPDRATIHGLLDSSACTGAYRFDVYPAAETAVEVTATLFPRRTVTAAGVAPLTSMFFVGENDRRFSDDFRPELHDSDGLLLHTGAGEWIWRPLRNPATKTASSFLDNGPRGFGLMQRDRTFENYQDLEATYHMRPGYWVEPIGSWGEGKVELVEIPTRDETEDNIVAYWEPRTPWEPGQEVVIAYRLKSVTHGDGLHPGAKAVNTYMARPQASGSSEPGDPTARRFIIDFAGGDLAYYLSTPEAVQVVPSTSAGRITHTFVVPNEHTKGFRCAFDVKLDPGQRTDLRCYLRAGGRALSETWTYPWAPGV